MDFVTLETDDFEYGVADEVLPGVTRVVAHNPSKFTYRGTGTYIVGDGADVAVIDPGPNLDSHRDALAMVLDGRTVRSILVTHCHADHSPLAAWLRSESEAPAYAYGPHGSSTDDWDIGSLPDDFGRPDPADSTREDGDGAEPPVEPKVEEATDTAFTPDVEVRSGDTVFADGTIAVTGVHTPGHTSNHMCFAMTSPTAGRVLFTGDHVMGWSTTVVSPPDGDMGDYMNSLRMVAGRRDDVAVPTHGSPIDRPGHFVGQLVDHRLDRERQVRDAVRRGRNTIPAMVTDLYRDVAVTLHRPAGASVLGHLVKLVADGEVVVDAQGAGAQPRLDSIYRAV
ncbi:MBL fold metallo-hydrolase [Ilumatobacter nonamiensis]|uniref:MBL fold metallo-hydrolase n=1 Tax=Ilumatobacter nonamiensis TaxID=467093 RepID=UPI0003498876|nr:MBL fold metallo-hydrolase [Ilumatobacter nonamiensis]